MLGQLGELVDVAPGQDALPVGDRGGQHARDAAGGQQDDVGLHAVLHGAVGIDDLEPVAELDLGHWQRQLDVNLTAPALLTRALLPALRAAGGTVVFVNSGAGLHAHPAWSAYAASKHGLRALADSLRGEEAGNGVRVSTVYPGRTATPMQKSVHEQERQPYEPSRYIQPADVAAVVKGALELPPTASVTDVTVRPPD